MKTDLLELLKNSKKKINLGFQDVSRAINAVDDDTDDNLRAIIALDEKVDTLTANTDGTGDNLLPLVREENVFKEYPVDMVNRDNKDVAHISLTKKIRDDFDSLVEALSGLDGAENGDTPAKRLQDLVAWANAHADDFNVLALATTTNNGFMSSDHVIKLLAAYNRYDIGETKEAALESLSLTDFSGAKLVQETGYVDNNVMSQILLISK